MRILTRPPDTTLHDRLVWQAASLLLAYPDRGHRERLDTVERLVAHLTGAAGALLSRTAAALRQTQPLEAETTYVDTFDLRRRSTLYLTYWTAGDTRNRGYHMLAFAQAYRDAGMTPPKGEAPDYLPVVLEFAATVDPQAGRRLLAAHRGPIEVLRKALCDRGSPYAQVITAVCDTLPGAAGAEVDRLMQSGPPTETVGLQPFTLTVPPRRAEGGR